MASIISAGTTAGTSLNLTGDTTGNLAFQTQAGANTITVPNSTGTMMVSGNMPTFSAFKSSNTTQTDGVYTKVVFDTKLWDTATCYNTSTGTFTPNVAGYYQLNCSIDMINDASMTNGEVHIYKNGVAFKVGVCANARVPNVTVSALVYANGTTDYFEIYCKESGAQGVYGSSSGTNSKWTWFDAALIRSA